MPFHKNEMPFHNDEMAFRCYEMPFHTINIGKLSYNNSLRINRIGVIESLTWLNYFELSSLGLIINLFNNQNLKIMSLRYKIWKRKFKDASGQEQEKYYAVKETFSCTSTEELAEKIEKATSVTKGDVYSVLSSLADWAAIDLSIGNSVKLNGIGTINISVKSTPMDSPDDIDKAIVKTGRITFRPDPKLKKILESSHVSISPNSKKGKRKK